MPGSDRSRHSDSCPSSAKLDGFFPDCRPHMRLLFLLICLVFVAAGILFGALNPSPARVDFYWFDFNASLGALLLLAAFIGAVGGGVAVWVGKVWPLQRSLRRARREQARAPATPATPADAPLIVSEHP